MAKLILAVAALLVLQIASGKVITHRVPAKAADDAVQAAIAQLEVDLKDVLAVHLQTHGELVSIEKEAEELLAGGKVEILKRYKEIADVIKQTPANDHNDACKGEALDTLKADMLSSREEAYAAIKHFDEEHVPAWKENKEYLKKVEYDIGSFELQAWLCDSNDSVCFGAVLDKVNKASHYVTEELKNRVGSQLQAVGVAGRFLEKNLGKIRNDLFASLTATFDEFNKCIKA